MRGENMENKFNLRIGNAVNLFYWRKQKVIEFTITDIFLEGYVSGYKSIIKAEYYSDDAECWYSETFFVNDFIKAMNEACLVIESEGK